MAKLLEKSIDTHVPLAKYRIYKFTGWSRDTEAAKEDQLKNGTIVQVGYYLLTAPHPKQNALLCLLALTFED